MKIELNKPYSKEFKAGYLGINKEPRRVLTLVRFDKTKTSTSYARYLMSCKLGRYLSKDEHVDHIDNDSLNDTLDNLQILTPAENNIKKNENLGIKKTLIKLKCPNCHEEFNRPARNINHKLSKGKQPCCSRSCGTLWYNKSIKKMHL